MFLYEKRIAYLSLYEAGEKVCSAGFVSLSLEKEEICVIMQIRNVGREKNQSYPVFLLTESQRIDIGTIFIEAGRGNCERKFYFHQGRASVNNWKIKPDEICAIEIKLFENRMIEGWWRIAGKESSKQLIQDEIPEERKEKDNAKDNENGKGQEIMAVVQEEPELKAVSIASDKWEQLKNQFKIMHPFGDEREFVSIEIKDFTVLREAYQKLVNNSFLLHGFYNYRHLILGKDCRIGTSNEVCFYLGVPGVFFEREKMVAVMFGFEGFESESPVEIGKFGYYLRRVEI